MCRVLEVDHLNVQRSKRDKEIALGLASAGGMRPENAYGNRSKLCSLRCCINVTTVVENHIPKLPLEDKPAILP